MRIVKYLTKKIFKISHNSHDLFFRFLHENMYRCIKVGNNNGKTHKKKRKDR